MPELPEVEHVRRLLEKTLVDAAISDVTIRTDAIIFKGVPDESIRACLLGRTAKSVGRRGKIFWIEFCDAPTLFGHLGMNGWVREWGVDGMRLHSHGDRSQELDDGTPRFLKLAIRTDTNRRVAFTDSRRLARIWVSESPETDATVSKLGPDAWTEVLCPADLHSRFGKRNAPIKAVLLDQSVIAGVGNWIADEVLYQARLSPARSTSDLGETEIAALHRSLKHVLDVACEADADFSKFPLDWMFHHRWGGGRGAQIIGGHEIVRDTVGGRTTAWVPAVQK